MSMNSKEWIGKSQTVDDVVTATPYAARPAADVQRTGRAWPTAPALWHWLYFLPLYCQSDVGPDGHAKRGGFLPPIPLPRRMWAGSQLQFLQPLCIGDVLTR